LAPIEFLVVTITQNQNQKPKPPMKNKIAKILFAISVIAAPLAARADLIWYEGFQYPNGNLTNVCSPGVWVNPGGNNGSGTDMFVNHSNLEVSTTSSTVTSRNSDDYRFLSLTNGSPYTNTAQLIYASFTVICTNLPNGAGSYFASFYNPSKGYCGRILAFTNGTVLPNTWRLAVSGNASTATTAPADGGYPVDLALNTPYQVVEELDPVTLLAATIWVNPLNISQTGFSPTERHYTSSDSISTFANTTPANSYAFRQAGSFGNGFWIITNLDMATTFAEAATNIWATNAQPPVVVYQPVGVTNYPGATITLSAVANGQGLGSLTYRWQQNGTNYPGASANILNIPSAQTDANGNYTLIVTTPYGLSVTSSIAKVFIDTTPVPPTFIVQPASQATFKGQTVTLGASVISPGNVTFTWYSNNAVVTGGISSPNADASLLTINNVQTNASGAVFRVAVTNDVVVNGIVSTNAVLTVAAASQVTIAYLRTLVDPVTFNPTNTPPTIAYQVTGTVTTYTNLTTGNTASYYLQDGTGGINIFATLGSTFRPAQGDVVTWVGVLSSFSTGLELYADPTGNFPGTSYTDTGTTNALPAPIAIPNNFTNTYGFAYVNTNLAGSLVQLTDVHFGTNAGTALSTTANNTIIVTNSSGQKATLTFFFLDLDTAGKTLPTNAYSVTGVLYGFQPTFSVGVTRWADIVTNPPAVLVPTNVAGITSFSLANTNVVVKGTNGQSGYTYYLLVSTNVAKPLSQWTVVATNVVNTNGANGAFTFTGTNVASPGAANLFYILSNTNSNHP
jgi:hypothetical protein